ncbi:hypothetical protein KJS94_14395 [Flavihumibacter rivuli]|uniref:hypothetical protein n=1 Tax=Flavihumibacter rivuli TaxID=2838156 RepID=UPI001BDDF3D0|nr:hypothetical protein [Flavihumibacter rivuli]ULQ55836.1 hypothetical protein KJS94_14395 [Flavihumibacter rivuli]
MRQILIVTFQFFLTALFGQTNSSYNHFLTDTCIIISNEISSNSVSGTKHSNPLIIANGIIVRGQQLDTTLIQNISILKCPEAFYKFNYAGVNGAILIQTKQEFKTVTPTSIRDKKSIDGQVIYAINGYYLIDSTLQISNKAIKGIDVLIAKSSSGINLSPTVINIWTLTKKERQSMLTLCRGVGITNLKVD